MTCHLLHCCHFNMYVSPNARNVHLVVRITYSFSYYY
uniref:Uncharacterized protein n=1 Tax=Anguilla anguilla TaxID=7936 RepID=A0A0E9V1Y6_ANGAN